MRFLKLMLMATALCTLKPLAALALCNVEYVVQSGDNVFTIAENHYGDRNRWTLIYYRNQDQLVGPTVVPGSSLYIPCPPDAVEADATPLRKPDAELTLLTGGGFAPFTDPDLPGQGMVTELVNAALELAPSPVSYEITWEGDWSQHLSPLLSEKKFDMGFPWYKPDCVATPDHQRCTDFHFSEPIVVTPIMLFTKASGGMSFDSDDDVIGKTLCRPISYLNYDLDRADRRWLSDEKITLVQPETLGECMQMVNNGQVDATVFNLFVGAEAIIDEGLRGKVVPLDRPVAERSLHVVISKTHWRGTSHLYRVNAGLKKLRESGRFEEIMSRHLELFWAKLQ